MPVQSSRAPGTWDALKTAMQNEFFSQDRMRRCREKLQILQHRTSVFFNLTQFRSFVIEIPDMNEEEKLDRFVATLKHSVKLKVLKSSPDALDGASHIILNVDSALADVGMFSSRSSLAANVTAVQAPEPMNIRIFGNTFHCRGNSFEP